MIDFNNAAQAPIKIPAPTVKQEVIQDQQTIAQADTKQINEVPGSYNYTIVKKSNNISVQIPQNVDLNSYKIMGRTAVKDVESRVGKSGQNLNWINNLQTEQLKNLDSIYDLAQQAKKDGSTDLVVLGMGGSRYPSETLVKMLGKDSKIHYFSGVDPQSFKNFADKLDLSKTKVLVVSKSGGTLETTAAYQNSRKLMQDYLKKDDVSDKFIAMTNKDPEKSKLRQIVNKGEIKLSGLVHDEISGGYSMFDDATLFTLAYAGVKKEDLKKMLQSSLNAQKEFMNPDIEKNEALKLAAFNVDAKTKGNNRHFSEYFGDYFEGGAMWEKQLKNEGLKSNISTDTNVGPEFLHYQTEADLDAGNKDSFYTFTYVKPEDKTTSALINGAVKAYSERHPVAKIELKEITPESAARFAELKHFETLYTGNMIRQKQNKTDATQPLPEVMQTNVNIYKKEVKKNLENLN